MKQEARGEVQHCAYANFQNVKLKHPPAAKKKQKNHLIFIQIITEMRNPHVQQLNSTKVNPSSPKESQPQEFDQNHVNACSTYPKAMHIASLQTQPYDSPNHTPPQTLAADSYQVWPLAHHSTPPHHQRSSTSNNPLSSFS